MAKSVLKERAERLKRRLAQVSQYLRIKQLIKLVKRFPDIQFRWVTEKWIGTGEEAFATCADPMDVAEYAMGQEPSPQVSQAITNFFPKLMKNWERRRHVEPCIHAEICITMNLSRPLLSSTRTTELPLPIRCSKRSCLCCILWMDLFRQVTHL